MVRFIDVGPREAGPKRRIAKVTSLFIRLPGRTHPREK